MPDSLHASIVRAARRAARKTASTGPSSADLVEADVGKPGFGSDKYVRGRRPGCARRRPSG
jgi:hypothetical protein